MAYKRAPAVDRFAEKVALASTGCLEWLASTNSTGYGTFAADGKSVMAHRWSFEHHLGPIPPGLDLDHLCRNRLCVNPLHLEPVSTTENLLRAVGMGQCNTRKTHCPAGHPYSEDNTYYPPGRLNRMCRTCRRNQKRAAKEQAA